MPNMRQFIPPSGLKSLCALALLAVIVTLASRHEETADRAPRGGAASGRGDAMPSFSARVVGVADGDTLTVSGGGRRTTRIRLNAIDAPELHQPGGQRSREALAALVAGRAEVRVEGIETDSYGRLVADLYVGTNWVNAAMVACGWAWHYRHHGGTRGLADAERTARARHLGLWRERNPTPPWVWRQRPENRSSRDRPRRR